MMKKGLSQSAAARILPDFYCSAFDQGGGDLFAIDWAWRSALCHSEEWVNVGLALVTGLRRHDGPLGMMAH
jgi:hypothetical protein